MKWPSDRGYGWPEMTDAPETLTGAGPDSATEDLAELPLQDLRRALDCGLDGLSETEAGSRLEEFGRNEIPEPQRNALLVLLSYFWGAIPWMIEVALILSILVRHWADAAIIGVLLVMNGVVAFWEEHQAASAIAALKAELATTVLVRRDGAWRNTDAADLVPGDLVRVRIGDVVPADARLVSGTELQVDQSSLTGESLPVARERDTAVYSGSVVVRGEADALVYATGLRTFFGRAASLVGQARTTGHFQQAVLRIGRFLIALAVVLVAVIIVVSIARGNDALEVLEFALVVTVAAVPVALPAVLSVTMAVGAAGLAKRHAVVSNLPAVEELGGMDVLCSDKTGTLTEGRLSAGDPVVIAEGIGPDEVMVAAAMASRAEDRDPIDQAVMAAVEDRTASADTGSPSEWQVEDFTPFDPVSKRTEARAVGPDGASILVTKGAPQVLVALAEPTGGSVTTAVDLAVQRFAQNGQRSIAVARREDGGPWDLLGVIPLFDPPRQDSASTVARANELGIEVKMLTGDQIAIAREIAGQVGTGEEVLSADRLDEPGTNPDRLVETVDNADGFAEVFPEHKYRIVQSLQAAGHVVGMTGDGVNDAPALKQADAGIAVEGATDAARAAADVVLLTPGLSVIIEAVRQAREIFQRMTNYAIYRIAETIRILLLITASILVYDFFPVTPAMIVLLALLNDGAILSIAYDRTRPSPSPERWDMRTVLTLSTVLGVMGVISSFGLFLWADSVAGLDRDLIRTLMYLKLSVAGHLTVFVARTRGHFWTIPPAPVMVAAVFCTQAIATLVAVYGFLMTPIGWGWAAVVWAYALVWFLINDQVKVVTYRWLGTTRKPGAPAVRAVRAR